jgi:large subunit ribosomal protein L30
MSEVVQPAEQSSGGTLRITLVRSTIGRPDTQERTVKALGLRRIRHTVERPDTPSIRGMVTKVRHLVEVEEVPAGGA